MTVLLNQKFQISLLVLIIFQIKAIQIFPKAFVMKRKLCSLINVEAIRIFLI